VAGSWFYSFSFVVSFLIFFEGTIVSCVIKVSSYNDKVTR
jgi:hypothetical protein